MSSTRNSGDWKGPPRLPSVREKLSDLVRRGRGLAKKTTMSMLREPREGRPSLDETQKAFPRVQVRDFGSSSLEIDLQALEAFRNAPPPEKGAEQQKKAQRTSSSTPIADMFARKATNNAAGTVNKSSLDPRSFDKSSLNKSSPSLGAPYVNKPVRVPAEERRPSFAPSHTARASSSATNVTIISSSRGQSYTSKPWPPPETPRPVASIRTQVHSTSDPKQPNRPQIREPRRAAYVPSMPAPITTTAPIVRPRQIVGAVAEQQRLLKRAENRHSTPTTMPSSTAVPNSLPAESTQTNRRSSWQTAPTSVPSGTSRPSAPPSASAPWRGLPNRRASARLGADRLAWIRELEGKKDRTTIGGDLPVLKTMQGGVADKLARFESKQQQQQQQLAPLTRSNSNRSRTSSIADTYSSIGGMATTRSSFDSYRTSSVFSHYDDSFRERMELIAGNANRMADDDNEEKPALTRVTSAFVSVDKRNKQACVDKPQAV